MPDIVRNSFTRTWLTEGRAGPTNGPKYLGSAKTNTAAVGGGDVTLVRIPDPGVPGNFIVAGKYFGAPANPTATVLQRYSKARSDLLRILTTGCDVDLQIHIGDCKDPRDFNAGWDKIVIIEGGHLTNWSVPNFGALDPGEQAVLDEEVPLTGEKLYEVVKQVYGQQASAEVTQEVVDITVCDAVACASCGIPSDGCQIVFGLTLRAGASPGTGANLIVSQDGGSNWIRHNISTFTGSNDPDRLACVGTNVVVVSVELVGLTYAATKDILNNLETWATVTTGFVGAPRAIWSADPINTWIVGASGYIYFTSDPTSGVTVQDAGVATTQQLNDVHGIDNLTLMAVGNSNAVVYTTNGGRTWASVTGPAVGVNLNACWMKSATEWWVGTAGGKLFYTRNAGTTWTEKTFPGSGSGVVRAIRFASNSVAYLSHDTAGNVARVLRSLNGGYSWYVAPESPATMPSVNRFNRLATCADPNVVWAGGLATGAVDGYIVKGA